jgi:large subunit ribosomal protein LX
MENEVKIFKITGHYIRLHEKKTFIKYYRALKQENAKELALSDLGSYRVRRRTIKIDEIKEIQAEDCPNQYIHSFTELQ